MIMRLTVVSLMGLVLGDPLVAQSAGERAVSVAGVTLGMQATAAAAALRRENPKLTNIKAVSYNWSRNGIPSRTDPILVVQAGSATDDDLVTVIFSLPPTGSKVTRVLREMMFGSGSGPSVANVIAGLRAAYGTPSDSFSVGDIRMIWAVDPNGKPMRVADLRIQGSTAMPLSELCTQHLMYLNAGPAADGVITSLLNMDGQGRFNSPEYIRGPVGDMRARCGRIGTIVDAQISPVGPIAARVQLRAYALRDEITAFDATRALVRQQRLAADSIAAAKAGQRVFKP
jgi:hypothetical protein